MSAQPVFQRGFLVDASTLTDDRHGGGPAASSRPNAPIMHRGTHGRRAAGYHEGMVGTRMKIEVSGFGRLVSLRVREEMRKRRLSSHRLAGMMGRSDKYVRDRTGDDKEWALSDLERICRVLGIGIGRLISDQDIPAPEGEPGEPETPSGGTAKPAGISDSELVEMVMSKLAAGELSLVVNSDRRESEDSEDFRLACERVSHAGARLTEGEVMRSLGVSAADVENAPDVTID